MSESVESGLLIRMATRVGVVYRDGGEPLPGGPGASRYERGLGVSPRLDQDLDALTAKIADLEARLAQLEAGGG